MSITNLYSSMIQWWKSRWLGNTFIIYHQPNKSPLLSVGPHVHGLLFTLCVIYGVMAMYERLLDDSNLINGYQSGLLTIERALALMTTLFLLLTGCSDPGIVTSNTFSRLEMDEDLTSCWCDICGLVQHDYLRIRHCYDCNICIQGMDHHCPWIGKCIGKKNMKWFILFNICWVLGVVNLLVTAFLV